MCANANTSALNPIERRLDLIATFAALAIFLVFLCIPPLIDPSEARYATIAQRMVVSGNWLVPEINRGDGFVPFWGKPPLHIWLVAASMKVFGFSEFAARLPSFISLCVVLWLNVLFAQRCLSHSVGRIFPFVMLTSPFILGLAFSCLIDSSFYLWTTLALVSFALAVQEHAKSIWSYLFFGALIAGFMTKGPLMYALVGFVTVGWTLLNARLHDWKKFPWLIGVPITFVLTSLWFVFAELKTPGLIRYFFVNENFLRFTSAHYTDQYGTSHPTFRGVIFVYFLIASLPLGLFFIPSLIRNQDIRGFLWSHPWGSYLALWALAPVFIFLPSKNVLITYLLPGIPALMLIFSDAIIRSDQWVGKVIDRSSTLLYLLCGLTGLITCIFGSAWYLGLTLLLTLLWFVQIARHSQEFNVRAGLLFAAFVLCSMCTVTAVSPWLSDAVSTRNLVRSLDIDEERGEPLTFSGKLPYSALFYLQADPNFAGQLPRTDRPDTVPPGDLVVPRKRLTAAQQQQLEPNEGTKRWAVVDTDRNRPQNAIK